MAKYIEFAGDSQWVIKNYGEALQPTWKISLSYSCTEKYVIDINFGNFRIGYFDSNTTLADIKKYYNELDSGFFLNVNLGKSKENYISDFISGLDNLSIPDTWCCNLAVAPEEEKYRKEEKTRYIFYGPKTDRTKTMRKLLNYCHKFGTKIGWKIILITPDNPNDSESSSIIVS